MKTPSPEQVMSQILDGVSHDEDGCTYDSSALQVVKDLMDQLAAANKRVETLHKEREEFYNKWMYENARRRDDEGVWLETRDANKRMSEEIKQLRERAVRAENVVEAARKIPKTLATELGVTHPYSSAKLADLIESVLEYEAHKEAEHEGG